MAPRTISRLFSGVDLGHLQVPHRDAVAAHAAGRAHALDDARRKRRGADRAGRAMEHRPVGRRAAGEVVALHDALKSLAAARADDVDALAVLEHRDQNLIADLRIAVLRQRHLAPHARRRHVGFLVVARERLAHLRRLAVDQPDLHRLVAVGRRGLALHDHARTRLDDRRRNDRAVLGEQLRHADFSANDSCDHMISSLIGIRELGAR